MKITLYPKYLINSLFVHGKHNFFKAGYQLLHPDYSRHGMTPWQNYVIDGKRKGYDNGCHPSDFVFFREGYDLEYPDVKAAGIDAWRHYAETGYAEGRDNGLHPAENVFFAGGYLEMYPDVAKSGIDPWVHYVKEGKKEGRDNGLHPGEDVFFADGYLEMYPDVAKAGVDPWKHYVREGKKEGRDNGLHPADNLFFADGYLEMYPDVAESGVDPWKHYVREGKKEGRDNGLHPNENVFFAPGYLDLYHDVVENGFEPWHHYVEYGKQEGRENGTANVDNDFYLSMYPDVRSAGISPVVHYFKYGKKEHRFPNYESLNKNDKDLELIRQSKYFDHNWYLNEYPNCCKDPAVDYYIKFKVRNPSVNFITNDYYRLNKDVECSGMNPLVHFEKYGKFQNRPMVVTFEHKDVFDADLVEVDGINCKTPHAVNKNHTIHNKMLVFAAFCKDGLLHDYRKNLIHELRQYCDYLVFVSDNPMKESEVRNCPDIDAFICRRHHRYDFGSYIYGIELLSKLGFLDGNNDLVLCNDSCLGPVCSFSPVFSKYDLNKSQIDFYGLTVSNDYRKHKFIQSFFIIFAPSVYQSEIFKNVFNLYNVPAGIYFSDVGVNCEGELTYVLTQAGFTYKTFVDENSVIKRYGRVRPTNKPLEMITVYGYPLLKRKFLVMNNGTTDYEDLVGYLKREKKDFWNSIEELITNEQKKAGTIVNKNIYKPIDYSFAGVRNHYSEIVPKIQNRIKKRGFIKVDFLVANLSMLAYRSLIDKMLKDQRFRVKVWIIPDIRWMKVDTLTEYRKCIRDITGLYGKDVVMPAVNNPESDYPVFLNIFSDEPDVVFYPTPYDLSYTPYNIPNAMRYDVLPAYINYGFPRNKYCEEVFKRTNYCNLWKVFLETQFQLDDYIKNGFVNGDNAVVAGYSKIDELYDITRKLDRTSSHTYNGKVYDRVVILAPHHSLEGGFNATMHLSNFLKYADFFQELPGKFKNILFVFRPHPALFFLLKQDRFWGEQKVEDYLKKIQQNDNLIFSTEGDYFHWFAASDAMIHDCGSFTVEYLYADKPCCYMLKSEDEIDEQFNDFGKQCLECYCHALSEEDIVRFIQEEVLQGKDSRKRIRTKFAHEVLMKDYPHSSEKIMNCLAETLMLGNQGDE